MKIKYPCLLLILFLTLMSCEIQEELSINDIGDFEPKLYLSGYVCNDSIYACLTITQKQQYHSIYTKKPYNPVITDTTAKVTIYEDGNYFCTLNPRSMNYRINGVTTSKNYYVSYKKVEEGKSYSIKVEHETMGQIEATTMLPKTIAIQIDTASSFHNVSVWDGATSKAYDRTLWITDFAITVDDQPQISNYYWLDIRVNMDKDYKYDIGISDNPSWHGFNDAVIEYDSRDMLNNYSYGVPRYMFSDKYFNGNKYKLDYSNTASSLIAVDFELHFVSEELYKYYASINDFGRAALDPFSKPVKLYSNTTNGMGIWGAKNKQIFYIKTNENE